MRIEAYNQVSQLYKTRKSALKKGVYSTKGANRDEVSISSFGRDLQVANNAVKEASHVREDKVASLKKQIDDGTYNVSTSDFASFLMSKLQ